MGAVYTVEFDLRFNETGRDRFNNKLRQYIEKHISNDTPDINTLPENMRAITDDLMIEHDDRFRFTGYSEFNACYSWEDIMSDGFEYALTECEDGSKIRIYPDEGGYEIEVRRGMRVFTYLTREEEDDKDDDWDTDDSEELEILKTRVAKAYREGQIQTVNLDEFPDCDEIQFEEIDELATDISQGTGNVIVRYFYFPALNIIGRYADF